MAGLGVAAALGGDGPVRAVGAGVPSGLVRALGGRAVQRGGGAPGPQEQPGLRRAAQALLPPHLRRSVPVGVGGGVGKAGPHPGGHGEARTPPPAPFSPFLSPSLGLPRLPAAVPFCSVGFGKLGFSPRRREAEGQGDGCV